MTYGTKTYIAIQVAQAVMFLHTSSPPMLHLDIKPANILVHTNIASNTVILSV